MDLHCQHILIIDDGTLAGLAMAAALAAEKLNNQIVVATKTWQLQQSIEKLFPASCQLISADITDRLERQQLVQFIEEEFGSIDILINISDSTACWKELASSSKSSINIQQTMESSFTAPLALVGQLLALFSDHGAIVTIDQELKALPTTLQSAYIASKAARHSLAVSLRAIMKKEGIAVFEVAAPDWENKQLSPADFAKCVLAGVNRDCYEIRPTAKLPAEYQDKLTANFFLYPKAAS